MSEFYLKQGNRFVVKKQKILNVGLGIFLCVLGVLILTHNNFAKGAIVLGAMVFFCAFLMFYGLTTKMVFDLNDRTFSVQSGGGKPRFKESLDQLAGIEIVQHSRFFGIIRHAMLILVFDVDGKTVRMPIRQFGSNQQTAQAMVEETEGFLGIRPQD